jgi:hypothetical protein
MLAVSETSRGIQKSCDGNMQVWGRKRSKKRSEREERWGTGLQLEDDIIRDSPQMHEHMQEAATSSPSAIGKAQT